MVPIVESKNAKLYSKRHLNDDERFTQNTSGAVRVPLGQHGPLKKKDTGHQLKRLVGATGDYLDVQH